MEFMRARPADCARIRRDCAELQSEAGEYARIRFVHVPIFTFETRVVRVKGVAVLHQELAGAHHAESRPDLIPELRLDLIQVDR